MTDEPTPDTPIADEPKGGSGESGPAVTAGEGKAPAKPRTPKKKPAAKKATTSARASTTASAKKATSRPGAKSASNATKDATAARPKKSSTPRNSAAPSNDAQPADETQQAGPVDAVHADIVIDHTPDTVLGGRVDVTAPVAAIEDPAAADAAIARDAPVESTGVSPETPDTDSSDAAPDADADAESVDAEPAAAESVDAEPAAPAEAADERESDDAALTRADVRPREEVAPAPRASAPVDPEGAALVARGLEKNFAGHRAVDGIDLTIPTGGFYGIVGPNGAGKTTTLSMLAGLLRPDTGTITIGGIDVATDARAAKRLLGVLPDRFRTFDRLTGHQLLHYYGVLRGLKPAVVESRVADLARAFDLTAALGRSVSDYSAGMTKKVMLAGALIHSPRVLILDEPFESVDPVSASVILDILSSYVGGGGTVILSAHGLDLVERVCSRVAFIMGGRVLAEGEVDDVRAGMTLEERFVQLSGGSSDLEGLEWLHTFSG